MYYSVRVLYIAFHCLLKYLFFIVVSLIDRLCSLCFQVPIMLSLTNYAQNYAGITGKAIELLSH